MAVLPKKCAPGAAPRKGSATFRHDPHMHVISLAACMVEGQALSCTSLNCDSGAGAFHNGPELRSCSPAGVCREQFTISDSSPSCISLHKGSSRGYAGSKALPDSVAIRRDVHFPVGHENHSLWVMKVRLSLILRTSDKLLLTALRQQPHIQKTSFRHQCLNPDIAAELSESRN